MLADQFTTPIPKPRPQRPPTQVGRTTALSLDAFATRVKMQKSRIEAARGDSNRVELVELIDEVGTMVPKGYTEGSWHDTVTQKIDLFTEDEKGEPDARVRYEDLKDDPYFQDYVDLIGRLNTALAEFGIRRPETPALDSSAATSLVSSITTSL